MVTLRLFVLIAASLVGRSCVNSEASIGCLFTEELCDKNEWCFDDNVFGRCLAQFGPIDQTNFYRYDLEKDVLKKLEHEMRRLFRAGYRWSHAYTQCILQNLLFSHRFGVDYNPSLCQGEAGLDQTIDLLKTDPKDLAVIHFSPSRIDRHSDFADEWFMPPLHREKFHQQQHYGNAKKFPHDAPSSEGLSSQGKHKRLNLDPTDMTNQQLMDLIRILNAQQIEEENLAKQEDPNARKAQESENDYIDSILNKLSPEELEELQNLLEAEISNVQENLENDDYNRRRNSLSENEQFGDNAESFDDSNALDANFWDGGFKRLHRYDVKKPGPNFMTNLDGFDSTEAVVNEQLQQASLFKLLDDMMQQQQQEKNESVVDQDLTADGMINSQDEGEDRSNSLEEASNLNIGEAEMEGRSAGETSKRKQDDPIPKMSPNLYGVPPYVPPEAKPANTDDFDVVDTSYAYIIVENGFRTWEDGNEFLNTLKELLHLPSGIFSNIRVEQDQVTFKVNPNAMGVNASQVASKAESMKTEIQSATGKSVTSAGIGNQVKKLPSPTEGASRPSALPASPPTQDRPGLGRRVGSAKLVDREHEAMEAMEVIFHPNMENNPAAHYWSYGASDTDFQRVNLIVWYCS